MITELLARAKDLVAEGEARLLAQEARVADLERKGREGKESWKLLKTMRDTQKLQIGHVSLLERELATIWTHTKRLNLRNERGRIPATP